MNLQWTCKCRVAPIFSKKKKKKKTKYTYRTGVSKTIHSDKPNLQEFAKLSRRVSFSTFVFVFAAIATVRDIPFFSLSSRNVVVGLRARRFNTLLAIRPPRRGLFATWLFQQISRLSSNDHNAAKSVAHREHFPSFFAGAIDFQWKSRKIAIDLITLRIYSSRKTIRTFIAWKNNNAEMRISQWSLNIIKNSIKYNKYNSTINIINIIINKNKYNYNILKNNVRNKIFV